MDYPNTPWGAKQRELAKEQAKAAADESVDTVVAKKKGKKKKATGKA